MIWLTPDEQSSQSTNTPSHDVAIAGSTAHSATTASTPTLCEVKIKPQNPYAPEPLPSARTLVVEFCRADGRVMKIHTTQDSIPTLIQNFYRGDAAC